MSALSRTILGCLLLACVAQGCTGFDAPASQAGRDHDLVEHARRGDSLPRGSGDPTEDQAEAARDAADAADELDGDELQQAPLTAGADISLAETCDDDPLGSFDYCSSTCLCGISEGDCDDDDECEPGLACMRDTGALFGFDPEVDVCMERCSTVALGTPDFCSSECPCEAGQGDCDRDSDCTPGDVCAKNVGASFGFAPDVDVCVDACDPVLNGTFDYCSSECPCDAGQGDCDRDSDCAPGLVCAENVGASYGFPANMDVCEAVQAPQERFTGQVIDENGRTVAGATVSINQAPVITGDDGSFVLAVAVAADRRYVINVEKFGYVPYSSIHAGEGLDDMIVTLAEAKMISLSPGTADIEDQQGTRIALSLPVQDALVDTNGEPPKGLVIAQMHTFDVVEEGMVGNMDAVDADGNLVALQSVGAVSVEFVDLEGNQYQLRSGQTAQISMELPPGIEYSGPIPLWHYDMEQGRWIEDGEGFVQDGMAFGVVSHFSAWNFDVKLGTPSCIRVTTTGLSVGESFDARVVIPPPSPFQRSQIATLQSGDNVLYNLPNDTFVRIFVPPDATSPIVSPVDTGGGWGGIGIPPDLSVCAAVTLPALNGHIRGVATMEGRTDHTPVIIELMSGGTLVRTAEANDDGRYVIADVPPQFTPYEVRIRHPGYLSMTLPVTVEGGKVHHLPCVTLPAGDVQEDTDVDGNHDIDIDDQDEILSRFGPALPNDPADYNGDGVIGSDDATFIGPNLGKREPLSLSQVQCPSGNVVSVAAGGNHTCTLMTNGRVRCWGGNTVGQLGYGNLENVGDDETLISIEKSSMEDSAIQLASGGFHSCVVAQDATSKGVRCWGYNLSGQLGYGHDQPIGDNEDAADAENVPLALSLGDSIVAVTAGLFHTCARTFAGQVHCWGENTYGQLGYGNVDPLGDDPGEVSAAGPVNVGGNVVDVVAGSYHTCALLDDRVSVRCWGSNQFGQLGYGTAPENLGDDEEPAGPTAPPALQMTTVPGEFVQKLVAGFYHTCAQFNTGHMRCWGSGDFGQLGYGDTDTIGDGELATSRPSVEVASIGFSQFELVAGGFHTCALLDGEVKCWGRASFGQLGYGATGDRLAPPADFVNLDGATVTSLSAGLSHTCARLNTGNVMCWGRSNLGQLGYGNTNNIGDDEPPSEAGTVPFLD